MNFRSVFFKTNQTVVCLVYIAVLFIQNANANNYLFEHVLSHKGSPIRNIRSIVQDEDNFLWFAGDEGLFRYDGNELINFNQEATNYIFLSANGGIWLTGAGALTRFSPKDLDISRYPSIKVKSDTLIGESDMPITYHIISTDTGRELAANQKGVSEYNSITNSFFQYQLVRTKAATPIINEDTHLYATRILAEEEGDFLIGTNKGLFVSNLIPDNDFKISLSRSILQQGRISQLVKSANGNILVGSDNGLYILDSSYQLIKHYPCLQETPCTNHKDITKILIDNVGTVWIGSSNGLYVIEPHSNKIIGIKHNSKQENSISNNLVKDLHQDHLGNIFVATYSGIDYFNRRSLHVKKNPQIHQHPINLNNVWSIAVDSNNNMWFGTFGGGLSQFTETEADHFSVDVERSNSLKNNQIPSLFTDSRDRIWVGSNGGLQRLEPETNVFTSYSVKNENIDFALEGIISITQDNQEKIWVSAKTGFAQLDIENDTRKIWSTHNLPNFQADNWVRSIFPYSDDKVLVGSDIGLHLFNPNLNSISLVLKSYILKIIMDSRGDIWVLSFDGLYLFNPKTDVVRKITPLSFDGIIDNQEKAGCNAMQEDNYQQLWLVCRNGLEVFDLATREFTRRFSPKDNVDMGGFLTGSNSLIKNKEGVFFAGMRSGIYSWKPAPQKKINKKPKTAITRIIYTYPGSDTNLSIKGADTQSLINDLYGESSHPLPHTLQNIKFHFSALGTPSFQSTLFQYRLKGFNDNWITSERNILEVSFNNLPASDYVFEVRAKYPDSVWQTKQHYFSIATPPWLSWWATILYLLLAMIILTLTVRLRTRQLAKNKVELQNVIIERTKELAISKSNIEALMQEKEKMIENIYHQTKTPLQLMLGNLSFLASKSLSIKQYVKKQTEEIFRLSRLTEQALTISKSNKVIQATKSRINLYKELKPLVLSYNDIARAKNLEFTWLIDESISTYCYAKQIEELVDNLLSNAMKYTQNGSIELIIKRNSESFNIFCSDSGIGVKFNEQENIFVRHQRASNAQNYEGAGIGLAMVKQIVDMHKGEINLISEIEKGCRFEIMLPIETKCDSNLLSQNLSEQLNDTSVSLKETPDNNDEPNLLPQILIVEDNIELAVYLKELLQKEFHVFNALNGEDGLKKAIDWVPDVIISDVMMGNMDGFQLCSQIRSNPITCHIPLLLLTAKSDPESRVKGYSVGANDFITKPFEQTALISRINNQLDHVKNIRKATINSHQMTVNPSTDKLIVRFLCFVEEHYPNSELLIKEICTALHISSRQLERKVRYFIDMTPNEYLNEYRLLRARDKLLSGHKIKTVISDCGFSSQAYFSRRYKQRFSSSPSQEITKSTCNIKP